MNDEPSILDIDELMERLEQDDNQDEQNRLVLTIQFSSGLSRYVKTVAGPEQQIKRFAETICAKKKDDETEYVNVPVETDDGDAQRHIYPIEQVSIVIDYDRSFDEVTSDGV